jgi:trehalose utilization protein
MKGDAHMPIRVLVWNEGRDEREIPETRVIYPNGIHEAIAVHLRTSPDISVATATFDSQPDHGCTVQALADSDVVIWWAHNLHREVAEVVVDRLQQRVLEGMGLIVLHSAHFAKIFIRLMGTSCSLKWREDKDEREVLWVTRPGHPLVAGIDDHFILDHEEMYGEFFDVPEPAETLLISSFTGGEVFRSLCVWQRGMGKVVYFRPGHETFPSYHNANVLRIIANAVRWTAPTAGARAANFGKKPKGWIDPAGT